MAIVATAAAPQAMAGPCNGPGPPPDSIRPIQLSDGTPEGTYYVVADSPLIGLLPYVYQETNGIFSLSWHPSKNLQRGGISELLGSGDICEDDDPFVRPDRLIF